MWFGRHAEVFSHLKIIVVIKEENYIIFTMISTKSSLTKSSLRCEDKDAPAGYTTQVQNIRNSSLFNRFPSHHRIEIYVLSYSGLGQRSSFVARDSAVHFCTQRRRNAREVYIISFFLVLITTCLLINYYNNFSVRKKSRYELLKHIVIDKRHCGN